MAVFQIVGGLRNVTLCAVNVNNNLTPTQPLMNKKSSFYGNLIIGYYSDDNNAFGHQHTGNIEEKRWHMFAYCRSALAISMLSSFTCFRSRSRSCSGVPIAWTSCKTASLFSSSSRSCSWRRTTLKNKNDHILVENHAIRKQFAHNQRRPHFI